MRAPVLGVALPVAPAAPGSAPEALRAVVFALLGADLQARAAEGLEETLYRTEVLNRTEQNRTEQDRTEQDRTGQKRTGQNRTEHRESRGSSVTARPRARSVACSKSSAIAGIAALTLPSPVTRMH